MTNSPRRFTHDRATPTNRGSFKEDPEGLLMLHADHVKEASRLKDLLSEASKERLNMRDLLHAQHKDVAALRTRLGLRDATAHVQRQQIIGYRHLLTRVKDGVEEIDDELFGRICAVLSIEVGS